MRYKCVVAYKGLNYVGFQSQKNGIAIQDVIESKLKIVFGSDIRLIMASRTDAGVHAYGQVFHFDSEKELLTWKVKNSLNGLLPKDIRIKSVDVVADDFHSRFNVKAKKYEYLINLGEFNVFLDGYAYQCYFDIDIAKIKRVSQYFVGRHDFGSFNTCSYDEYPNQVRTIHSLKIIEDGELLKVEIIGDGFLRHMVRMIVGTLIDLGRGKKSEEEVIDMINNPNKTTRRYNIDPNGLYLVEIYYEEEAIKY